MKRSRSRAQICARSRTKAAVINLAAFYGRRGLIFKLRIYSIEICLFPYVYPSANKYNNPARVINRIAVKGSFYLYCALIVAGFVIKFVAICNNLIFSD